MTSVDWGSLHMDLLTAVLGSLSRLCHEAAGGALSAAAAAHLLASCSPNRHWRSVALSQLHCHVQLESISDMACLAALPGPPCTQLELPQPPSGQPPWKARQAEAELAEAACQLLGSPTFHQRSAGSLAVLLNLPLAAASDSARLLHRFTALEHLSARDRCGGGSRAGTLTLGSCPPSLRQLTLHLPGGGALRHASLPARLQHCEVVASSGCVGGSHCHIMPEEGAGSTPFWSTCISLQLTAAAGGLLLSLDHCHVLRSCVTLRIRGPPECSSCLDRRAVGSQPAAAVVGRTRRASADLHRWLQALAPLFAATPLQVLEVLAGAASLHTAPDGSQPLLLVGNGPSCWQPAELAAAALPAGHKQSEWLGGLAAELRRWGDYMLLSVHRRNESIN